MRVHNGTLLAGIAFLLIGVAFMLEALEVWTIQISDLRYVGPIALVVLGAAVVIGSLGRSDRQS